MWFYSLKVNEFLNFENRIKKEQDYVKQSV